MLLLCSVLIVHLCNLLLVNIHIESTHHQALLPSVSDDTIQCLQLPMNMLNNSFPALSPLLEAVAAVAGSLPRPVGPAAL